MNAVGRSLSCAGVALAAAGALACSSSGTSEATAGAAAASNSSGTTDRATTRVQQARRAIRTAHEAVGHGRPYDVEHERDHGAAVWEVKVASGSERPHEISVSADGRRVVQRRRDDDRSDDAREAQDARIGLRRALRIAGHRGSGALSDAEIDRDRGGMSVWTATFERFGDAETEVFVDAVDGHVVSIRHDDD